MRKTLLGVALAAAAGCTEDFTLVGPETAQQQPPLLSVLVRADRSDSSRYRLEAFFFRGVVEAADSTLYVDRDVIRPTLSPQSQLWSYVWRMTRADGGAHADSLRIRPPILAGSPSGGFAVTIPITGREGPMEVAWSEGQDLRLPLSPAPGTATELAARASDWTLELGDGCAGANATRVLFVQGRGPLPAEFRVPWEWLVSATPAPAFACLRALSVYDVPNAPYRVDVFLDLQLTWRIGRAGAG